MAGSGDQISALVRSFASGDEAAFQAVALQIASQAARQGQQELADDLRGAIDASRRKRANLTRLPKVEDELSELVSIEHPDLRLSKLVLTTSLREQLKQILTEQRQRRSLMSHGFAPAHRLLLEGPPGTGKTMTAAVIAGELDLPLLTIRIDSLMSKFLGETASKLRRVFNAVAERRGVYLFDEFDALGADRAGNDVGEAKRILNSFLVFLENSSPESVVIAATNNRFMLDRALFRRFDMILKYDLPDWRQATSVMKARLGGMGKGIDWAALRSDAAGLSHADLVQAAESAAKRVLMKNLTQVDTSHLSAALKTRQVGRVG